MWQGHTLQGTGRNLALELFSLENKRVSVTVRNKCQLQGMNPFQTAGYSSPGSSKPAAAFLTLPNQAARVQGGDKSQKIGNKGKIDNFSSLSRGFSLSKAFLGQHPWMQQRQGSCRNPAGHSKEW